MATNRAAITPGLILAGIGLADRKTLAQFLAFFESQSVLTILADHLQAHLEAWTRTSGPVIHIVAPQHSSPSVSGAHKRLQDKTEEIEQSHLQDQTLRLMLWMHLRNSFELPPELTYSLRGTESVCQDLAAAICDTLDIPEEPSNPPPAGWVTGLANRIAATFSRKPPRGDFSSVVKGFALAQIKSLLDPSSPLPDRERRQLAGQIAESLKDAGPAVHAAGGDEVAADALRKALATGGTLVGLSVAVELAGFSAYILAAKLSAMIPFITGPTLVSWLAVVSNPLFVIPVALGGAHWANSSGNARLFRAYSAALGAMLALSAIARPGHGVKEMAEVFRQFESLREDFEANGCSCRELRDAWEEYAKREIVLRVATPLGPSEDGIDLDRFERPFKLSSQTGTRSDEYFTALLSEKGETALLSALTIGDVLYHAAFVEPSVIAAADFSRVEDIDGIVAFADFSERLLSLPEKSLAGAVSNLKGYVAERYVAARLVEQGHVVEFPGESNQAGFDLLVDGREFQVKCLDSVDGVRRHLETYPDIPVLLNSELAEEVSAAGEQISDHVFFVDGFSGERISEMTEAALDSGGELLDHDVPLFLAGVAAARNLLGWWKGQVSVEEAFWATVTTASGKAGLSLMGSVSIGALGLLLFGPAGAIVGKPVGGILGATQFGQLKGRVDDAMDPQAKENVNKAAGDLLNCCVSVLRERIVLLERQMERLGEGPANRYVRFRLEEDVTFNREQVAILGEMAGRILGGDRAPMTQVLAAVVKSGVHPAMYQGELRALTDASRRLENTIPRGLKQLGDSTWDGASNLVSSVGDWWRSK